MAFERLFVRELPFGTCVGVSLPAPAPADDRTIVRTIVRTGDRAGDEADPFDLPSVLHAAEVAFARGLSPIRRAGWVGGRVALRAALAAIGVDAAAPILATARGAPTLPSGAVGSVSHKSDLAVALAARATAGPASTLGIDVEMPRSLKQDIARHVLTPEERAALPAPGPARDAQVLLLFSAKEAIYKALDPWVQRFVSFQEATIARRSSPEIGLTVRLALPQNEGLFTVELHDASTPGVILVAARASRL